MACRKRVDKHCADCGVLMVDVPDVRIYCFDCAKKHAIERQIEYNRVRQQKRKASSETPQVPVVNPNKKYCKGCWYWGADYINNACCNYIFIKGHSRPCPPGKDCTEKIIGKRKKIPCGE